LPTWLITSAAIISTIEMMPTMSDTFCAVEWSLKK